MHHIDIKISIYVLANMTKWNGTKVIEMKGVFFLYFKIYTIIAVKYWTNTLTNILKANETFEMKQIKHNI